MSENQVVFMGLGLMGAALSRRILATSPAANDRKFFVWNRSVGKTEEFSTGGAGVFKTPGDVFRSTSRETPVFVMLKTYEMTKELLLAEGVREELKGRLIINLCSGNPSKAREFSLLMEGAGVGTYVDACYAGAPSVAQQGKGVLFLSAACGQDQLKAMDCGRLWRCLEDMGDHVVFTGTTMGGNKALDYAYVDVMMMNLLCLLNGLAMCEKEGVSSDLLFKMLEIRMPLVLPYLKGLFPKLNAEPADYDNVIASLSTWKEFVGGRFDWLKEANVSTLVPEFVHSVVASASDDQPGDGKFLETDFTRIQEAIRFNREDASDYVTFSRPASKPE